MRILKLVLFSILLAPIAAFGAAASGTLTGDGEVGPIKARGLVHVHLSGTFGGGTVTIQFSDGSDWLTFATEAELNAATDQTIALPDSTEYNVKVVLTGSSGPSLRVTIRE